jgi:hypothetical protein
MLLADRTLCQVILYSMTRGRAVTAAEAELPAQRGSDMLPPPALWSTGQVLYPPMNTLYFDQRFNGPPASVNGGIAAGSVAEILEGAVRVRLLRPIPLERKLALRPSAEQDGLIVYDSSGDIMAARRELLALEVPEPPDHDRVAAAGHNFQIPPDGSFANCFVCGHDRDPGDGMRVHAGQDCLENSFAAVHWTPHENFADETGTLPLRFVWGALDCPGAIAAAILNPCDMVTGEMHGEAYAPVHAGETYTVFAWPVWAEGRKIFSGSALIDSAGQICAKASELWITV